MHIKQLENNSFLPWIVSSLEYLLHSSFQKWIVSAETIRGNTVVVICWSFNFNVNMPQILLVATKTETSNLVWTHSHPRYGSDIPWVCVCSSQVASLSFCSNQQNLRHTVWTSNVVPAEIVLGVSGFFWLNHWQIQTKFSKKNSKKIFLKILSGFASYFS